MAARNARIRTAPSLRGIAVAASLVLLAASPVNAASPALPAGAADHASTPQTPDATTVIVRYRDGTSNAARGRAIAAAHASLQHRRADRAVDVVAPAPGETLAATIARLEADPAVAYAEPNARMHLASDPTLEPLYPYQWGLENNGGDCAGANTARYGLTCVPDVDIDAAQAWSTSTGAGVTVAVLDDGLDFGAADLAAQAWVNPGESGMDGSNQDKATNGIDDDGNGFVDDVHGVNLCTSDATSQTLHRDGVDWHGTAVASVLGAAADGLDAVGVAPDVKLMAVRWLVGSCGSTAEAAAAIDYAVENGADVINASWGGSSNSSLLEEAIAGANAAGVLIIAAAGNSGSTARFYPAASSAPNVLSVGAIDPDGYRAEFSNYGTWVDVAAPGSAIVALCESPDTRECPMTYSLVYGTSFAAPHAAGIAALALQANPSLGTDAVALRTKLIASGVLSSKLDQGVTGTGRRVNAARAVDVTPPSAPLVSVRATTGATAGSTASPMTISWPAATDASGIESYRVRSRPLGTTTWTTLASATTARSAAVTLACGKTYELQVTARDRAGNAASTTIQAAPHLYTEGSSTAAYAGSWGLRSSSSYLGGRARATGTANRSVTWTITGRSAAWVAAKGPTRGSAKVYVDGTYVATVSLYSTTTAYRGIAWSRGWTTAGPHTITIVVVGTSGHPRVDIDGLIVAK